MTKLSSLQFLTPLLWPSAHIIQAIRKPHHEKPPDNLVHPLPDIFSHFSAVAASVRHAGLAWICIYYIPHMFGTQYPAFGPAQHLSLSWMMPIIIRNLLSTWIICGLWDWFLYFSPLKNKLHKYKMNPVYPNMEQLMHDALYTTMATLIATAIEIMLCHFWATGWLLMDNDISMSPILNTFLVLTLSHWRSPHFYTIHRFLHPWRTTSVPDLGKIFYRRVHSLHHKSYNPTAFSGTSMHPVEAILYYSAALIPAAFGLHPILSVACIVDCGMAAWLSHDGFQWPGTGTYFHFLHHKYFECNYGGNIVPLDWFFGSFAACKQDLTKTN